MKNVHILPTDKPSRLHLIEDVLTFTNKYKTSVCDSEVNIYITSDEEIKEGDWCFDINGKIFKHENHFPISIGQRKIILTTDPDLIADGVQSINDKFLEWFIANPSYEEVEVEKLKCTGQCWKFIESDYKKTCLSGCELKEYKIIIPQEEPKQETLEEFIKSQPYYGYCTTEYKEGIEVGAKWQSERMYSEEDLHNAFYNGWLYRGENYSFPKAKKEWFKQFKKK
jgi:hypothetical protein